MHMVAFLPVPPQQLFPSGGFLTFTLIGPWSDPVALFFAPMLAGLLPIKTSLPYCVGWAGLGNLQLPLQLFPSGGLTFTPRAWSFLPALFFCLLKSEDYDLYIADGRYNLD